MAEDKDKQKSARKIDKQIDAISNNIDDLYQSSYSTRIDNNKNMNTIVGGINSEIDEIISKINGKEVSDISSLYVRLVNRTNSGEANTYKKISDSIAELFDGNSQLLGNALNFDMIRKSIQAENYQYDLICKYMPKLEDALEIMKDNVLSSDNFTKDFINIISRRSDEEYINLFNDRALILKDKYNIQELFEEMYYKTSKYGEYFLYEVPYKKAYERLLQRKERLDNAGVKYESKTIIEASQIINENDENNSIVPNGLTKEEEDTFNRFLKENFSDSDFEVKIIFDDTGIATKPIEDVLESAKIIELNSTNSLTEAFNEEARIKAEGAKVDTSTSDKVVNEDLLQFDGGNGLSQDGIFTANKPKRSEKVDEIAGAVLSELERENVIPVYMNNVPLGYIYLIVSNTYVEELVMNGNTYNSLVNVSNTRMLENDLDRQNDLLIGQIAGMMAREINAKFINANVDLKEEIYAVLRYNDHFCSTRGTNNVTVTFLPVEDVHHFYFKLNKKTHRGISDLERSLTPAMIYCMLYLNNAIATVGRSGDKRIYYVKQNVEQNVARTMLNVISQLKKGNMGMRQLTNLNTIFNVIGKFNDHVIPVSPSGDHPIDFEVMPGQNIDTPTDLMDRMEDMAISSTDVPTEFVQSVQNVDYATRFTMSNSKFLRKVYQRQRICQKHYTQIFEKIYNFEYNEHDMSIQILLPAPAYLSMTNMQQLINNVKDRATAIADMTFDNEADEKVKQNFINLLMKNDLGTYIDFSMINNLVDAAKIKVGVDKDDPDIAEGSGDEY